MFFCKVTAVLSPHSQQAELFEMTWLDINMYQAMQNVLVAVTLNLQNSIFVDKIFASLQELDQCNEILRSVTNKMIKNSSNLQCSSEITRSNHH